jgi:Ca2+-transporting ATPase
MLKATRQDQLPPHALKIDEVVARFGADIDIGLTGSEAAQRLATYGPNSLPAPVGRSSWRRFLTHFRDVQVYLLLVAAAVSFMVWLLEGGEPWPLETIAILAIVWLNALFGYLQEEKADGAMRALRSMTPDMASVLRNGETIHVEASLLVPGDLLLLSEGDRIAADARLIETAAFHTQEAALTGESLPVMKSTAPLPDSTLPSDRQNMVYSGTLAVSGHARAIVTHTGQLTEFGAIAALLKDTSERVTPLQKELNHLGRRLGVAVILIAAIVVVTILLIQGIHDGNLVVQALLFGVALAVAATPEGMAAVVTVVLALGVRRMARRGSIIRHLSAVETLGEATVIASDKTGTMTMNNMTVRQIVVASGQVTASAPDADSGRMAWISPENNDVTAELTRELDALLAAAVLCTNASLQRVGDSWKPEGDPTETALLLAAAHSGKDPLSLLRACPRLSEIPFSSERKRMTTFHHCGRHAQNPFGAAIVQLTKGAPDVLLELCTSEFAAGQHRPLSPERRQAWLGTQEQMASHAMRTLGVAMRARNTSIATGDESAERLESELTFLGLVGMMDPPRPEVRAAVITARAAGVKTLMITGDHAATAQAIARELDIPSHKVITGSQMATMNDEDLARALQDVFIFARVNPEHKLRIVKALQQNGEIVAMTGDGVNDAPALKAADIGVAMGITGNDVSREAADMVITDDNFATIVTAIEEGRGIFDNIRKFLRYLLSTNAGEILTLFLGAVLTARETAHTHELVLPLLATQILWMNLITDGAPALVLGLESPCSEVMRRPPFPAHGRLIDSVMLTDLVIAAVIMAIGTLTVFFTAGESITFSRTMAFITLILFQLFNTLQAHSSFQSSITGMFRNRWLWVVLGGTLMVQVVMLHLPWIAHAFGVVPLGFFRWIECALVASSIIWSMEIVKWVRRQHRTDRSKNYAS